MVPEHKGIAPVQGFLGKTIEDAECNPFSPDALKVMAKNKALYLSSSLN